MKEAKIIIIFKIIIAIILVLLFYSAFYPNQSNNFEKKQEVKKMNFETVSSILRDKATITYDGVTTNSLPDAEEDIKSKIHRNKDNLIRYNIEGYYVKQKNKNKAYCDNVGILCGDQGAFLPSKDYYKCNYKFDKNIYYVGNTDFIPEWIKEGKEIIEYTDTDTKNIAKISSNINTNIPSAKNYMYSFWKKVNGDPNFIAYILSAAYKAEPTLLFGGEDDPYVTEKQKAFWGTELHLYDGNANTNRASRIGNGASLAKKALAYAIYKNAYTEPMDNTDRTSELVTSTSKIGPLKIRYVKRSVNDDYSFGGIIKNNVVLMVDETPYSLDEGIWKFTNGQNDINLPSSNRNFYIVSSKINFENAENIELRIGFKEVNAEAYWIKLTGNSEFTEGKVCSNKDCGKRFLSCGKCNSTLCYKHGNSCRKYIPPSGKSAGNYNCGDLPSSATQMLYLYGGRRTVTPITLPIIIKQKMVPCEYNLRINKVDENNSELSGAEFNIVPSNELSSNSSEIISPTISGNSSTTIKLKQEGTFTYEIRETTVPEGYQENNETIKLTIIVKKDENKEVLYIESASIEYNEKAIFNENILTVKNNPITLGLSGKVWLDAKTGKTGSADGKMIISQNGDKPLEGIKVILYDSQGEYIDDTSTNSNGYYFFVTKPGTYKVGFEYDAIKYATTKMLEPTDYNTSKADETLEQRETINNKIDEITQDSRVFDNLGSVYNNKNEIETAIEYEFNYGTEDSEAKSEFVKLEKEEKLEVKTVDINVNNENVQYINLGLVERNSADFELISDISNIEVTSPNEMKVSSEEVENPQYETRTRQTISVQQMLEERSSSISEYRNATYEVKGENLSEENTAKITYKVKICNSGNKGKINEIVLYLDNALQNISISEGTYGIKENIIINGYRRIRVNLSNTGVIAMNSSIDVYVTGELKVPKKGQKKINYFIAEISSYSTNIESEDLEYQKWYNACIEKDSQPENTIMNSIDITQKSVYERMEDDVSGAPIVVFENIEKTIKLEQDINGHVWKDENKNGIREDEEEKIKDINVKLICNGVEKTTKTGDYGEYGFDLSVIKEMRNSGEVTNSNHDEDFERKFEETYYVVFSYQDNNNEYHKYHYESTIKDEGNDSEDSDASDDASIKRELTINNTTVDTIPTINSNENGEARTDGFIVTTCEKQTYSHTEIKEETGEEKTYIHYYNYIREYEIKDMDEKNIDWGLKETPKPNIELIKEISYIKITLVNGNVLTEAEIDEESKALKYIGDVEEIIKKTENLYSIEVAREILNGATLEIKYKLYATNNGEDGSAVKISKIIDYVDKKLSYDEKKPQEQCEVVKELNSDQLNLKEVTQDNLSERGYNIFLLYNNENPEKLKNDGKEYVIADVELFSTFSSEQNDWECINIGEILEYTTLTGQEDVNSGSPGDAGFIGKDITELRNLKSQKEELKDTGISERLVITPPTGEKRIYYALAGTILLIIIEGVILIKKTVKI